MKKRLCTAFACIFILTLAFTEVPITHAATIPVGCDVAALIAAINTANGNAEDDVIELAAGCTYTLTAVDNNSPGANGLPLITQPLTIIGNGVIIERDSASPAFRLINVNQTSVTLRDLTLRNGNSGGFIGGNLHNESGTVVLINVTISGGTASSGGGFTNVNDASLTLINSVVSGNRASGTGGGIQTGGGTISTLTVINSTISGNFAGSQVGGIYTSSGTVTVRNSVIWGNNSQIGGGGATTVEYSGIEGGFAGTGNLNLGSSAPVFVDPQPAASAPTSAGDYHLVPNSRVINMGSNDALPADTYDLDDDADTTEDLPYDRDNASRIQHDTVDMGAYEKLVTELVINGGFEIAGVDANTPSKWNQELLNTDRRVCGDKGYDGTDCAFRFSRNTTGAATKRLIRQKISLNTLKAGETLTFSAARRTQGFSGDGVIRITAYYADETQTQKQIVIPDGNTAWELISRSLTFSQQPTKVLVMIRLLNAKGTAFIDQVSLSREVVSLIAVPQIPVP